MAALPLESERAHRIRHELLLISFVLFALVFLAVAIAYVLGPIGGSFLAHLIGLAMALLGAWMTVFALECFARSVRTAVPIEERELTRLLLNVGADEDLVNAFLESDAGRFVTWRLQLPDFNRFLTDRRAKKERLTLEAFEKGAGSAPNTDQDFARFAGALAHADSSFGHLLALAGASEEVLVSVMRWYLARLERLEDEERWWSRERLLSCVSLGRLWAFGRTDTLDRFSDDLTAAAMGVSADDHGLRRNELDRLLATLAKSRERNILVVAESGGGSAELLLAALAHTLVHGSAQQLGGMRLLSMNGTAFLGAMKGGGLIESTLVALLSEAVYAGNVIVALPDFGAFLAQAKRDGVDLASLLDPYLESALPVIAVTDPDSFHTLIEPNPELMRRFDKITIAQESEGELLADALTATDLAERQGAPPCSYQALAALAQAPRYFPESSAHDKIHDLLLELVPQMLAAGKIIVLESDVNTLVEEMTHIPVGIARGLEQDKLLNLEKLLHERIIGQDEGIVAIARAMRRARSGVESKNRPVGSFLFLGPTGVGKTETAKALAAIFFGDEKRMVRLDMSEYQDQGSVTRLIGSFESGKPGTLASMVRDNPYSVVLLDEFEKSGKDVQRLFLQVLDEGQFSDMAGKPVSLRNSIIIATSNAVADKIFSLLEAKVSLEDHRDELVDEIVKGGIFPPELLNRFDQVVFYRSLTQAELAQVARLMLNDLAKRLLEKGIIFMVNDAVIRTAMQYGNDPKFGARPMRRAIADHIEDIIARRIIAGTVKAGDTVNLTEAELLS